MFWLNYFGIHIGIKPSLLWRLTSTMESKQSVLLKDTLGGFETYLLAHLLLESTGCCLSRNILLRPDMNEQLLTGTLSHRTITTHGSDKFYTLTVPSMSASLPPSH